MHDAIPSLGPLGPLHLYTSPAYRALRARACYAASQQAGPASTTGRLAAARAGALTGLRLARGPGITGAIDNVFGTGVAKPTALTLASAPTQAGLTVAGPSQHGFIGALGAPVVFAVGAIEAIAGVSPNARAGSYTAGMAILGLACAVSAGLGLAVKLAMDVGLGLPFAALVVALEQLVSLVRRQSGEPLRLASDIDLGVTAQRQLTDARLSLPPKEARLAAALPLHADFLAFAAEHPVWLHRTHGMGPASAPAPALANAFPALPHPAAPDVAALARSWALDLDMPTAAPTTAAWLYDVSQALSCAALTALAGELAVVASRRAYRLPREPDVLWSRAWRHGPAVRVEMHGRWHAVALQPARPGVPASVAEPMHLRLTVDVRQPMRATSPALLLAHSAAFTLAAWGPEALTPDEHQTAPIAVGT